MCVASEALFGLPKMSPSFTTIVSEPITMSMPSKAGSARISCTTAPALRSASFLHASGGLARRSGSSDSSTSEACTVKETPACSSSSRRRGLAEASTTRKGFSADFPWLLTLSLIYFFLLARKALMGSTSTPRLFALTAKSPWIFVT